MGKMTASIKEPPILQPQEKKRQNQENNHDAIKNHLCPLGFLL